MKKIGIIFDLDGTLLDTLQDLLDATNYALNQYGFPKRTLAQLRQVVGNGAMNQIRKSLPEGTPEETVAAVLAAYKPYYTAHCRLATGPYPGIPAALEALGKRYPLAIVSNKPDAAVKALCADFFPGIYALGETAALPRKPAPDMVSAALDAIGAEDGVYVGDSEVDIRTAQNAGIPCVSVLWGFRDFEELEAAGGEIFCRTPEELPACVDAAAGPGRDRHGQ